MSAEAEYIVRGWAEAVCSGNSIQCNGAVLDSESVGVVLRELERFNKLTAAVKRTAYVWERVEDPTAHLYPRDAAKVLREALAAAVS